MTEESKSSDIILTSGIGHCEWRPPKEDTDDIFLKYGFERIEQDSPIKNPRLECEKAYNAELAEVLAFREVQYVSQ